MPYTTDQIINLAPDASSVEAAKKLTSSSKWPLRGCSEKALWGHCQGSGKNPYEVYIDLQAPAFKCTCPSRKFPCKHSLALLLMYAENNVEQETTPDWVAEWLDKRNEREQAKITRSQKKTSEPIDINAQLKKQAKRITTMQEGLADCEKWLLDLVAHGFASVQHKGYSIWDTAAARLVDRQAPGAAALVQRMGAAAAGGSSDWLAELTILAGRLFALIRSFRRFKDLSDPQQADVRAAVGWPMDKDEVLDQGETRQGTWMVIGESIRDSRRLHEQRTWLYEEKSRAMALVLNFQSGNQPRDISMIPGTIFDAEIAFYPGSFPLRALIKKRQETRAATKVFEAAQTIEQGLSFFANASAVNPWISIYPLMVSNLVPHFENDALTVSDREGRRIRINSRFKHQWELMALSGGLGVTLAGEWEKQTLLPLGCWTANGFYRFETEVIP